jgi:hypothetical protein
MIWQDMIWQTYCQTIQLLYGMTFWMECESRIFFNSLILSFDSVHFLHWFHFITISLQIFHHFRESDNNRNLPRVASICFWHGEKPTSAHWLRMVLQEKKSIDAYRNLLTV